MIALSKKIYGYYLLTITLGLILIGYAYFGYDQISQKRAFLDKSTGTGSYAHSLSLVEEEKQSATEDLKVKSEQYRQSLEQYDTQAEQILTRTADQATALALIEKLQKYYNQDGLFLVNRSQIDQDFKDQGPYRTLGLYLSLKCSYKNLQRFLNLIDASGQNDFELDGWRVPLLVLNKTNWRDKEEELLKLETDESRIINGDFYLTIYFAKYTAVDSLVKIQLASSLANRLRAENIPTADTLFPESTNLIDKAKTRQSTGDYREAYELATQAEKKLKLLEVNLHSLTAPHEQPQP